MTEINRRYTLITGAASDIGEAIAIELSKDSNLLLTDIDEARLKEVAARCDISAEVMIFAMPLDDVDNIEDKLLQFLNSADITVSKYVHCAGIAKQVPVKMLKADYFTAAFNVNVVSSAMIIKALASRKNKKALQSAVLIASVAALRGVKAFSVYGSTKAAILGLTTNLAVELAPKVRVNAISPGSIRTRATSGIIDERFEEINAKYPLGIGSPRNLTGMVKFLLSDEAEWITGQNFVVDGGRSVDGTD